MSSYRVGLEMQRMEATSVIVLLSLMTETLNVFFKNIVLISITILEGEPHFQMTLNTKWKLTTQYRVDLRIFAFSLETI